MVSEMAVDREMSRAAILVITEKESANSERYGGVMFLDVTAVGTPLGWTVCLITLVDEEKGIVSGGLLFTANEREEMLAWLLRDLSKIIGLAL
jgi:hypothetical protein